MADDKVKKGKSGAEKKSSGAKKAAAKKKVVVKKATKIEPVEKKAKTVAKKNKVETKKRVPMKVKDGAHYATGRRKESTAKVWLFRGNGTVKINHSDPLDYLNSSRLVNHALTPLSVLDLTGQYDVRMDVFGGGLSGQSGACRLALAQALLSISDEYRVKLREHDCLTQDSREKERKKYGKRGARKSPQFRKR